MNHKEQLIVLRTIEIFSHTIILSFSKKNAIFQWKYIYFRTAGPGLFRLNLNMDLQFAFYFQLTRACTPILLKSSNVLTNSTQHVLPHLKKTIHTYMFQWTSGIQIGLKLLRTGRSLYYPFAPYSYVKKETQIKA